MWEAIFDAIGAMFGFWTKVIPSDKLREDRFEVMKETLIESQVKKIADKRNKLADEMFGDLVVHPELSVEDKVNFEASELNEGEKELLIEILKARLNNSPKYNRIKKKKSKFKL
jgi:hypothetical protein